MSTKKTGNNPIGARVQTPYHYFTLKNNAMFPKLKQKSLSGATSAPQEFFQIDRKIGSQNAVKEAVNILLKLAPKDIKDLLGFSKTGTAGIAIREFIEPISANDQCIRASVPFKKNETVCWLCGCVIREDGIHKACEHVIPALRAIMLKGLITNKEITGRVHEEAGDIALYQTMTRNNYLWAHADCNGGAGKGRMVLIDYDVIERKFIPDTTECALLDSKIRALTGRNCYYTKPIKYTDMNVVNSPYEAYVLEMEYQCQSINEEFVGFAGDVVSFCTYAMNRAKLFITQSGSVALLSEDEKNAITQRNKEREKQLLQREYEELNEFYTLLKKDIFLSRQYFSSELQKATHTPGFNVTTYEQKIAYYTIAIELYLLYFNLESGENNVIKDQVLRLLMSDMGTILIEWIPLDVMLTLVYIFTQTVLFYSLDGHYKLLDSHAWLELDERIDINRALLRFRGGRRSAKKQIAPDITKKLFILDDGSPDTIKFTDHVCDFLATFVIQHIIFNIKNKGLPLDTNESDEITPIPVTITDLDLQLLKQQAQAIPRYVEPIMIEIMDNNIPGAEDTEFGIIAKLFFSIRGMNINICMDKINDEVRKRFTDSGIVTIAVGETEPSETDMRLDNQAEKEEYSKHELQLLELFNDFITDKMPEYNGDMAIIPPELFEQFSREFIFGLIQGLDTVSDPTYDWSPELLFLKREYIEQTKSEDGDVKSGGSRIWSIITKPSNKLLSSKKNNNNNKTKNKNKSSSRIKLKRHLSKKYKYSNKTRKRFTHRIISKSY